LGAGLPAYRARQVCEALYRRGVASIEEIKVLSAAWRADREARLDVGSPMHDHRLKF
jgi:adenine C2-methylase RlmN of 23S rRNA A2503 and tRNA A37